MSENVDRVALGERLKYEREEQGYSQDEVAQYLGLSRSAISLMESGDRRVDVLELKKLATLYECTVAQLLEESPPQEEEADFIRLVARASKALSSQDREAVFQFVQYLRSRKPRKT